MRRRRALSHDESLLHLANLANLADGTQRRTSTPPPAAPAATRRGDDGDVAVGGCPRWPHGGEALLRIHARPAAADSSRSSSPRPPSTNPTGLSPLEARYTTPAAAAAAAARLLHWHRGQIVESRRRLRPPGGSKVVCVSFVFDNLTRQE